MKQEELAQLAQILSYASVISVNPNIVISAQYQCYIDAIAKLNKEFVSGIVEIAFEPERNKDKPKEQLDLKFKEGVKVVKKAVGKVKRVD